MNGGRKLSPWNIFVKKIYHEGKAKNSSYQFKQALVDASRRKSEMGSSTTRGTKSRKGSRKSRGKKSMAMAGGKSRKNRKH
jgi:hypothetical protein